MYSFAVILGAITILRFSAAAEPNQRSGIASSLSIGAKQTPFTQTGTYQHDKNYNFPINSGYKPSQKCPLCDSSVYPYCGEKLFHDACCCTNPYIHELPYQCKLADCRFLHANTCREHRLISTCCCSDDYRSLLKSFSKA